MKIEIAVGTVLGASEYVAEALSECLQEQGFDPTCHFMPKLSDINLANFLIVVTSTHGAGDLPDNIQSFAKALSQQNLTGLKSMVIGLGDSSYDTFCEGAASMEKVLTDAGANMVLPVFQIDVLHHPIPEEIAVEWLQKNISLIANN